MKWIQYQQILISTDNDLCLPSNCQLQELIVVGITARLHRFGSLHKLRFAVEQFLKCLSLPFLQIRLELLPACNVVKLGDRLVRE